MASLDKISSQDDGLKKAVQRVAFFLGLNYFNDLKFSESIVYLDKSLQYSKYDPVIEARATFWKAEALYRTEDFSAASVLFQRFSGLSGAQKAPEYKLSFYNLGYSFFRMKEYEKALAQFKKYISLENGSNQKKLADAWNRAGDCQFMSQNYSAASESYRKSVSLGASDPDYAMFQDGFSMGLLQRHDQKIEILDKMVKTYPSSSWVPAAIFETGRAYVVSAKPDPAVLKFQHLIDEYPSGSYVAKAYLELALIAFNKGQNEEAIKYYKTVVSRFPDSEEARGAMLGLRTVYSDMNEGDTFLSYAESLEGSMGDISVSEQESISFRSAQNLYIQKEYEKAIPGLTRYLEKFPNGSFAANARYFLADCYVKSGKVSDALTLYEQVASTQNSFTEESLLASARIRYQQEEWQEAQDLYHRLSAMAEISEHVSEAVLGEMRCAFKLGNYESARALAQNILDAGKSSAEITREAGFIRAKSLQGLERDQEALDAFRSVAKEVNSSEGAESKFRLIEILYNQRKIQEASDEVFDFVAKNSTQTYWVARSFLVLSDIYIVKKDLFQASHTLQSLIDNYDISEDGIVQMAKEKKKALESLQ
jgi:TolA-binding protein